MADNLITFSADINLGQISVIVSIVGSAVGVYIKSKLDLQKLTHESVDLKADVAELKADMRSLKESNTEIKTQLAANAALLSMRDTMKKVPDDLLEALREFVQASAAKRTRQQFQRQPSRSDACAEDNAA